MSPWSKTPFPSFSSSPSSSSSFLFSFEELMKHSEYDSEDIKG
jgi:hypothetical protein